MTEQPLFEFPEEGLSYDEVTAQVDELKSRMTPEESGKFASTAFWGVKEANRVIKETHEKFFSWNALFTFQEAPAAQMENEVIDVLVGLVGGTAEARGNLTSGGTESNFCGLHAMRGWARERYPDIHRPEIVAPYSIHSTVHKMARILDIKVITVPQKPDLSADVQGIRDAIGPDTIGLACSAPNWPYATVDPVQELGEIAVARDLWLHVDACVGGFMLPFFRELGERIPDYDLSVPGVRSLTIDLHKYAFAPKPLSSVLWRSQDEQRFHFMPVTEWPCGLYLSQSFVGSRPLAPIAAMWALIRHLGKAGYREHARKLLAQRNAVIERVAAIDGLTTWPTDGPLLQIAPDGVDIQLIVGAMEQKGWRLLGVNDPPAIHLTIDVMDAATLEHFLGDLEQAALDAREGRLSTEGLLSYGGVGDTGSAPKWLLSAVEIFDSETH